MIDLNISFNDELERALVNFGSDKNISRITNLILSKVGRDYRKYMGKEYLSGQMINGGKGSNSLLKRMMVFKDKKHKNVYLVGEKMKPDSMGRRIKLANIYEHSGGYVIVPKNKKALMFVTNDGFWHYSKRIEGKERPFMSYSFKGFGWQSSLTENADKVFESEFRKAHIA